MVIMMSRHSTKSASARRQLVGSTWRNEPCCRSANMETGFAIAIKSREMDCFLTRRLKCQPKTELAASQETFSFWWIIGAFFEIRRRSLHCREGIHYFGERFWSMSREFAQPFTKKNVHINFTFLPLCHRWRLIRYSTQEQSLLVNHNKFPSGGITIILGGARSTCRVDNGCRLFA